MKLSKLLKKVILIWLLVLLLASVAVYFLVIAPLLGDIANKEQTLAFEKQKNIALKQQIENGEEESIPVTTIRSSIPESMEEDEIIRMINQASNSSNVVIQNYEYVDQSFTTVSEDSGTELEQLTMHINGEADTLTYLNQFVNELEAAERLVNIQSFNYQTRSESVTFQLEFQVYAKDFSE
ncbi:hypothetical protein E3U55_15120 [Filobacillus milosensis]|uniref:Pilus assembly protein PilO n=1 Tax=Filobacillus milosensis TaxID=94137 RepID=A0A4Y8IGM3_9BACI|nr:hypothetical protein [Filobacillus milosensis]TFB13893.1 hypothetical protein E3U55_15120 [Filobacillus milosensis]